MRVFLIMNLFFLKKLMVKAINIKLSIKIMRCLEGTKGHIECCGKEYYHFFYLSDEFNGNRIIIHKKELVQFIDGLKIISIRFKSPTSRLGCTTSLPKRYNFRTTPY